MRGISNIDKTLVILVLGSALILAQGCQHSRTSDAPLTQREKPTNAQRPLTTVEENLQSEQDCCKNETPAAPATDSQPPKPEIVARGVTIPDVTLINQDGQPVNVARDLAAGKLLVIDFIFTTCTGVCPPMGLSFGQLQGRLAGRLGRDVNLVSVSVDPVTDTPARLKAWSTQFSASAGWTLLTGKKQDVDHFLKALGVFAANKTEHSPFILVGRVSDGRWRRIHGLTPTEKLAEIILGSLASPDTLQPGSDLSSSWDREKPKAVAATASENYFTDIPLIDQHGKKLRLYSDILKGKVVVITPFFTTCRGSCPHLLDTFAKLQTHYEDRLGKDLYLVSLTVDPDTDTPDKLKSFAQEYHALPGWRFLTGDKQDVELALAKLGHRVRAKEEHSNVFIIGNDATGLWKKAMGLAPPAEIIRIVESVLNDKPS
jgi:cytochrome oxidase Cu insertion factor (SCO1/SenC/PrrC family)